MENKEKNNSGILIALVIVLFLLVLGMGGYIFYDKVLSNSDAPTNEITNNVPSNNDVDGEKLPEWAEYLLKQNITDIEVYNRSLESFEPGKNCPDPEKITKEQFSNIVKVMVKSDLTNYKNASGFGGPCMKDLIVKYNDGQEFKLLLYKFIVTKDVTIKSLLEKEKYIENTIMQGDETYDDMYAYEWDTTYLDTLLG